MNNERNIQDVVLVGQLDDGTIVILFNKRYIGGEEVEARIISDNKQYIAMKDYLKNQLASPTQNALMVSVMQELLSWLNEIGPTE